MGKKKQVKSKFILQWYTYIFFESKIAWCVCVCVCVCAHERVFVFARVCLYMFVFVRGGM